MEARRGAVDFHAGADAGADANANAGGSFGGSHAESGRNDSGGRAGSVGRLHAKGEGSRCASCGCGDAGGGRASASRIFLVEVECGSIGGERESAVELANALEAGGGRGRTGPGGSVGVGARMMFGGV